MVDCASELPIDEGFVKEEENMVLDDIAEKSSKRRS